MPNVYVHLLALWTQGDRFVFGFLVLREVGFRLIKQLARSVAGSNSIVSFQSLSGNDIGIFIDIIVS